MIDSHHPSSRGFCRVSQFSLKHACNYWQLYNLHSKAISSNFLIFSYLCCRHAASGACCCRLKYGGCHDIRFKIGGTRIRMFLFFSSFKFQISIFVETILNFNLFEITCVCKIMMVLFKRRT